MSQIRCTSPDGYVLEGIVIFLITKIPPSEPLSFHNNGYKLTYDEFLDICSVLKMMTNDTKLFHCIGKTCESIAASQLPLTQKNSIKDKLLKVVDVALPNATTGIKHVGYKLITKARIQSLDKVDKIMIDKWVEEASTIDNISDRALVFCYLAEYIKDQRQRREQMIATAMSLTKHIPSNYDRFNRIDALLTSTLDTDKANFTSRMKQFFQEVLVDANTGVADLAGLIDMAQLHEPKLAEQLVEILDRDPNRRRFKEPIIKRIARKEKINEANKDIVKVTEIESPEQVAQISEDRLADLNSGKSMAREVSDTFGILNNISKLPLDQSYNCAAFVITNAVKKYANNDKGRKLLSGIFQATIDNSNLIDILSTDSLRKMRNKMSFRDSFDSTSDPRFTFDSRELALQFLRDWITKNVTLKLYVLDPYFSSSDLELLRMVNEINPSISTSIVTGLEKNTEMDQLNAVYQRKWSDISNDKPPITRIEMVWIDSTTKCPLHDRWWIADDGKSGLKLGTSFNSIGLSKESTNHVLNEEELATVGTIVKDYAIDRVQLKEGVRLRYRPIELD